MENKETKQEEVKVERVCGYTVWENTDGSIDVEGLPVEGRNTITSDQIYEHILKVADLVEENKKAKLIEDAAAKAAYYAMRRALIDHNAMMAEQKAETEAKPEVEA